MNRKDRALKLRAVKARKMKRGPARRRKSNREQLKTLVDFVLPSGALFPQNAFHGNIKWAPEQLAAQALIWSWQDSKLVTDAFEKSLEVCGQLGLNRIAYTYTSFMDAISRYRDVIGEGLRLQQQNLARKVGGERFRMDGRVLMAIDGSRATAPRSMANEKACCAPNYGNGMEARYGKKKSKGLRRKRNQANKPHAPGPQVWITMMWHMRLRLPWTWRLGPSNSSERGHVQEILEQESFPEKTLFCGDAGLVGFPLWKSIIDSRGDFLVRVGANVHLLGDKLDILRQGGGVVLCWPKGQRKSGSPLRLRLIRVKVGKTRMWLLTSILDKRQLTVKQITAYYAMRWGIEVEFRGLKQTIDKNKLRCKNSDRLLAELDWSLRGMAIAELIALKQQLPPATSRTNYEIRERSLAKTMRALRRCMRNLAQTPEQIGGVLTDLLNARVDRYRNTTDKRARYRPKNPDIKPLGDPKLEKITPLLRKKIEKTAA